MNQLAFNAKKIATKILVSFSLMMLSSSFIVLAMAVSNPLMNDYTDILIIFSLSLLSTIISYCLLLKINEAVATS